jgi:uncharacterized protein YndB with AHSA1/START domain
MSASRNSAVAAPGRVLVITRVIDAPPDLVFKVWSSCEHMVHWIGPEGFTVPHCELEPRVGGKFRACMRSPDGTDHWVSGVTLEIEEPKRIVSTHAWENPAGTRGHETVLTVTFEPEGRDKTRLTLHQAPFDSVESRDGHNGGWSQSLDKFGLYAAQASKGAAVQ